MPTTFQLIKAIETETKKNKLAWIKSASVHTFYASYSNYCVSISKDNDNNRYCLSISDSQGGNTIQIDSKQRDLINILPDGDVAVLANIYREAAGKALNLEYAMKDFLSEIYFDKNR